MPRLLPHERTQLPGLKAPVLDSQEQVTGATKERHRLKNKRRRQAKQQAQQAGGGPPNYWTRHEGQFNIPLPKQSKRGAPGVSETMCPTGLALHHPTADILEEYAEFSCPTNTGKPWTKAMVEAAIARGPHKSALEEAPMKQLNLEAWEKEARAIEGISNCHDTAQVSWIMRYS